MRTKHSRSTRDYETNCKALTDSTSKNTSEACKPTLKAGHTNKANFLLYQASVIHYKDSSQLSEETLSNIVEQAKGRLAQVLPEPTILITSKMNYSLRMMVKGVIDRDTKSQSIRTYLTARTELEQAANKAHELLWKRFVESTGYQPIP